MSLAADPAPDYTAPARTQLSDVSPPQCVARAGVAGARPRAWARAPTVAPPLAPPPFAPRVEAGGEEEGEPVFTAVLLLAVLRVNEESAARGEVRLRDAASLRGATAEAAAAAV